ncbi:MAG: TPM domain-containing protein [Candidatus Levyibacteriota bacterium]
MKRFIVVFVSFFFLSISTAFAATNSYPDYTGFVNDFSHVLSMDSAAQLDRKLALFNQKTTNQIAVVTVDTTQPETIEEYGIHLSDKWKVGQKGKDNGIIMIFAIKDHQMRIEVGRGLEGDVTDVQSKHIQTDIIEPAFKQGHYETGINDGANAVIGTIMHDQNYAKSLTATNPAQAPPQQLSGVSILFLILLLIVIVLLSIFTPFGGILLWILFSVLGGSNERDNGGGGENDKFGGGGFSGGGSSDNW